MCYSLEPTCLSSSMKILQALSSPSQPQLQRCSLWLKGPARLYSKGPGSVSFSEFLHELLSLPTIPPFSFKDPALFEPNVNDPVNPMYSDSVLFCNWKFSKTGARASYQNVSQHMAGYFKASGLKVKSTLDISPRFLQKLISTMYKKCLGGIQRNSYHPFWFVSTRI